MVVWYLRVCITYICMWSMCIPACVVWCEVCVGGGVRCGVGWAKVGYGVVR